MSDKLRKFGYVLITVGLAIGLLYFGLIHLPAAYGLLWLGFVFIVFVSVLYRLLGPPQSSYSSSTNTHRLTRSRDHWIIAGVCGGIAEFLGWQPGMVRALWLLGSLLFAGVGGVVAYIMLAFAMPLPPNRGGKFRLDDFRVQ